MMTYDMAANSSAMHSGSNKESICPDAICPAQEAPSGSMPRAPDTDGGQRPGYSQETCMSEDPHQMGRGQCRHCIWKTDIYTTVPNKNKRVLTGNTGTIQSHCTASEGRGYGEDDYHLSGMLLQLLSGSWPAFTFLPTLNMPHDLQQPTLSSSIPRPQVLHTTEVSRSTFAYGRRSITVFLLFLANDSADVLTWTLSSCRTGLR